MNWLKFEMLAREKMTRSNRSNAPRTDNGPEPPGRSLHPIRQRPYLYFHKNRWGAGPSVAHGEYIFGSFVSAWHRLIASEIKYLLFGFDFNWIQRFIRRMRSIVKYSELIRGRGRPHFYNPQITNENRSEVEARHRKAARSSRLED